MPVSAAAHRAAPSSLNGVAVEMNNRRAFALGPTLRGVDPEAGPGGWPGLRAAGEVEVDAPPTLHETVIGIRARMLLDRLPGPSDYARSLSGAGRSGARKVEGRTRARTVARVSPRPWPGSYAKLLAYKDEYEVARLYASPAFAAALERQFTGDYSIAFHLAPPWLPGRRREGARPRKRRFGPWMMHVFRLLARLRGLRGTPLDPFGYSADRRLERELVRDYEARIDELIGELSPENHSLVLAIASIPEGIRGYGHVKRAHVEAAREKETELLQALSRGHAPPAAA